MEINKKLPTFLCELEENNIKLDISTTEYDTLFKNQDGILPLMIPDFKIYRRDGDYEYNVVFNKETIYKIRQNFLKTNEFNLKNWITRKDSNGIPKGSWVVKTKDYLVLEGLFGVRPYDQELRDQKLTEILK